MQNVQPPKNTNTYKNMKETIIKDINFIKLKHERITMYDFIILIFKTLELNAKQIDQ